METLAGSVSRTQGALARERLVRRAKAIEAQIEKAVRKTDVYIDCLCEMREQGAGEILAMMSMDLAPAISEALREAAEDAGLGACAEQALDEGDEDGPTRAHAKAWLEGHGPAQAWDTVVRMLDAITPEGDDATIGMERMVALVKRAERLAQTTRTCAAWAAREACWHLPEEALDGPSERWAEWAVRERAKALGRGTLDERSAREAIAGWRWPEMDPPLDIVAAGAGKLRPIQSESAWANALAAEREREGCSGEENEQWAAQVRHGEEGAAQQARDRVRALAREGPRTGEQERLQHWSRRWGASNALEGDGTLGEPKLEVVDGGNTGIATMLWVFDIHGPEALAAGAVCEGVSITEAIRKVSAGRGAKLVATIDPEIRYAQIVEGTRVSARESEAVRRALEDVMDETDHGGR